MWCVFFKEVKCLLRDKRTMLLNTFIPLLIGPALLYFSLAASTDLMSLAPQDIKISVNNMQTALTNYLVEHGYFLFLGDDYETLLKHETSLIHLVEEGKQVTVRYNPSSAKSAVAAEMVKQMINAYAQKATILNLQQEGIPQDMVVQPVILLSPVNTGQASSVIIMLFPLMVLSYGIMGVLNIAGDLGVGEKVKGTLEPLLSTSIKRHYLVLGKFLAICAMGVYSAICAVLGLFMLSLFLNSGGFLTYGALLWLLILVILASAFLSAVGLLLSIRARNFRESSTYTALLSIFMGLPSILSFNLNPYTITWGALHIPFYNLICVIKELIVGIICLGHILLVCAWIVIYIGVFLFLTNLAFKDEKVLFRI